MTRFTLHQVHLENPDRFYLPLPKLTLGQMVALEGRLGDAGYSVKSDGDRLQAAGGPGKITIFRSGLARSAFDMLDVLAPALPELFMLPRESGSANPYFVAKKLHRGFVIQFFPRMEALRIWTVLRRAGECGLTPDEKTVISHVLRGSNQHLECVTDYPTEDCTLFQVGRRQYFRSKVASDEFVSRLRTVSSSLSKNCYLPRSSIFKVEEGALPSLPSIEDLGGWCFLGFVPKSL